MSSSYQDFVFHWNSICPVDRWWREKYKTPFNSSNHRATCFIDMYFEFQEDSICKEIERDYRDLISNTLTEPYIPGKTDFIKIRKFTQKDEDDFYDSINVDEL